MTSPKAGTFTPAPCALCNRPITAQEALWRADGKGGVWFTRMRQPAHMRCEVARREARERQARMELSA